MRELKFVDVGEGITEGHVQKWLVGNGSTVKEDQPIVQVETDKAVVTVPAPMTGIIKINVPENSDVHVGETLAYFGTEEELKDIKQNAEVTQIQQPMQKEVQAVHKDIAQAHEILAPPSVRKLAHELSVDLGKITGSGAEGRITETDVRAFAASTKLGAIKPLATSHEKHLEETARIPLSQVRKAIARNMEISHEIPSAAHMDLIDATHLVSIVQKEKPNIAKLGTNLTFTPFIIKAVIQALKENERFNASYDKERQEIILKKYYNIGLAAKAEDGLRVLVVKEADKKSIIEIAKETQELARKIKDKTITIEEMNDTSFTITNVGSLGGGFLSVPIINYPDVAILGVHMIRDMPVVKDNAIVIGKVLPISIIFDHRVVDGADAVKFGNTIKEYLEDPEFLEMLG